MNKILLIDDDVELSTMLKTYLDQEGFETTVFNLGTLGIDAAISENFDLVILDVMLPDINGISGLSKIRSQSTIPVIMLTARGDDIDRIVGLEMGADDYLPKPCVPRELAARIRAILRRASNTQEKSGNKQPLQVGELCLHTNRRQLTLNGSLIPLTSTEYNLLTVLMENPGEIVSKESLCLHGLGRNYSRYDRSVDVHISSIRKKLQQSDTTKMIETVHGHGYQLTTPIS